MDKIHIRDLALRCIIGIYPFERKARQDVVLNITMDTRAHRKAARTDRIEDAVDYKEITKDIIKLVEGSNFQLIETMAEKVAERCLANPKVSAVQVSVDKPGALRFARSVAVEIFRKRTRKTP